MAMRIQLAHDKTGVTLYFQVRRRTDGQIWNTAGTPAFEAFNGANVGDYDVGAAAVDAMGYWVAGAAFPAGITTPGTYDTPIYERAGGSPAVTDLRVGVKEVIWDGADEVSLASLSDLYTVDVGCSLHDNDGTPADRWTVVFLKNGVRITSGVTSPTMTVTKRSNGEALLSSVALDEIASTEAWKYDASGAERIDPADIQNCFAVVTATIDGSSRTMYGGIIIRDETAAGSP